MFLKYYWSKTLKKQKKKKIDLLLQLNWNTIDLLLQLNWNTGGQQYFNHCLNLDFTKTKVMKTTKQKTPEICISHKIKFADLKTNERSPLLVYKISNI